MRKINADLIMVYISFLGMALPSEVERWIEETTLNTAKKIQEMKELIANKTLTKEVKLNYI